MKPYPELRTDRLILRELALEDAPSLQRLAGEWEVARMMLFVPYPYEDGMAEEWIATCRPAYEAGERMMGRRCERKGRSPLPPQNQIRTPRAVVIIHSSLRKRALDSCVLLGGGTWEGQQPKLSS
jgi:hypothetical protein